MLTLKVAKALESMGKKGRVALIDGAPKFLKKLALDHLPENYSEETVQNIILMFVIFTCFPEDNGLIPREVLALPSWDARVRKLTDLYKDKKLYSEEYGVKMCNALVNRMMLTAVIDTSTFDVIKNAPLTLIRPSDHSVQEIEENYCLDQYSPNTISIRYMEGNHATVLENPKLPITLNSI
jgi:fatty acid synthase